VASSTLFPEHQMTVANVFRKGGHLQAVTTARIMQELSLRSHALKDDSLRGRMELHCQKNINLHLILADSHLILALPRLDGTYDLENVIISREEAALEWGRMLFYYFLSGSEKVDLNTF
jgi:predicted transcriptional regulator